MAVRSLGILTTKKTRLAAGYVTNAQLNQGE